MDDLAGKLNEILNNPTEMAKFQQMANNLLGQMNTEQQNKAPEQPAQQSPQQSKAILPEELILASLPVY